MEDEKNEKNYIVNIDFINKFFYVGTCISR